MPSCTLFIQILAAFCVRLNGRIRFCQRIETIAHHLCIGLASHKVYQEKECYKHVEGIQSKIFCVSFLTKDESEDPVKQEKSKACKDYSRRLTSHKDNNVNESPKQYNFYEKDKSLHSYCLLRYASMAASKALNLVSIVIPCFAFSFCFCDCLPVVKIALFEGRTTRGYAKTSLKKFGDC